MKTRSCKAKGARLQNWVADVIERVHGFRPDVAVGGENGKDVKDRELPYSIECKNQERVNVWAAYKQATDNAGEDDEPLVFIKRNHHKPLAVVDAEWVIQRMTIIGGLLSAQEMMERLDLENDEE